MVSAIHPVVDAAAGAEGAKEQPSKPKLQQPKMNEEKKKGKKDNKGAKGSERNGTGAQQGQGQGQQPQQQPKKQQQDNGGKKGQQQQQQPPQQGQQGQPVVLVFEVEMGAHGATEGSEQQRVERLELRRGQRLGPAVKAFCRQHGLNVGSVVPALEAYLRDKAPPGAFWFGSWFGEWV